MSDEDGFLRKLIDNPADDTTRLVYADWLLERADPESLARSEFLRLECELTRPGLKSGRKKSLRKKLAALARPLDTTWLAVVSKLPIENCNFEMEFRCPKKWEELRPAPDEGVEAQRVRFCEACQKEVHYCETIVEAREHARRSHCIAVDCAIPRQSGDLIPPRLLVRGKVRPTDLPQVNLRHNLDEVSQERERRRQEEGRA